MVWTLQSMATILDKFASKEWNYTQSNVNLENFYNEFTKQFSIYFKEIVYHQQNSLIFKLREILPYNFYEKLQKVW